MYDHIFYKQVQISRSDIRPHIKWGVVLVILHMVTSISLQGLCGYIYGLTYSLYHPRGANVILKIHRVYIIVIHTDKQGEFIMKQLCKRTITPITLEMYTLTMTSTYHRLCQIHQLKYEFNTDTMVLKLSNLNTNICQI